MSTFVLVHGWWHDGSSWKAVIKHLEAKGHEAFAYFGSVRLAAKFEIDALFFPFST